MTPWSPVRLATALPDARPDPRLAASLRRLQAPDYDAAPVLRDGVTGAWPGDYPGRLLLALTRLAAVTGTEPRQLQQLLDALPGSLNAHGYLGPVHHGYTDEQQLAGHGWLVSGLLAQHRRTGDARARELALGIVQGLFLPAAARLPDYPRRRPGDDTAGGASGSVVGRQGSWLLSSDTYCVFIALEGLVAAYAETRDRTLADAVDALAALVDRDDLVAARAQLHATLTAARTLHSFHELTGSASALASAVRLYDLYAAHGRTANHATWNWFGRADSWTEPCAVADSLLLALGLWRTTGAARYLADAHAIEHNGLGHAQKPHGGFGLDTVTGGDRPWLANHHPDAAWCCSMRGAVALAELRERGYGLLPGGAAGEAGDTSSDTGTDTLTVDLYRDGTTRLDLPGGALVLRQTTGYPVGGRTELEVRESGRTTPLRIRFVLPPWTDPGRTTTTATGPGRGRTTGPGQLVTVPAVGDRYTVDFPVGLRTEPVPGPAGAGRVTLRHGVLLLGAEPSGGTGGTGGPDPTREPGPAQPLPPGAEPADPAHARYRADGLTLAPVAEVFARTPEAAARYRARVVFDAAPATHDPPHPHRPHRPPHPEEAGP